MMEQTSPEQSFYLKPMIRTFFRKWKALAAYVLAGAILLGGYKAFSPVPTLNQDAMEELEDQIETCQSDLVVNAQKRIDNRQTIAEKRQTIQDLQEDMESEEEYLALCRSTLRQVEAMIRADSGENAVELLAQLTTLRDNVLQAENALRQMQDQIESSEKDIERIKKENAEAIPKTSEELQKNLTELQAQKEDMLAAVDPANVHSPKKILLFAVVGGILGGCLRAVQIFCATVRAHRLQDPEEITENYGTALLSRPRDLSSDNEAYRLAAAKLLVQLEPGQEVLITGTLPPEQLEQVCAGLLPYAQELNFRVVGDPARDPDATLALRQAAVLLVEACGQSDFHRIVDTMNALALCQDRVVGLICL